MNRIQSFPEKVNQSEFSEFLQIFFPENIV